jgi:hypothetical protein
VRILVVLNTPGFLRYYDETIDALLERGHEVVLGFTDPHLRPEALDALECRARVPEVIGGVPSRDDRYAEAATRLRTLADFLRYLDPRFARAQWLRDRRRVKVLESPLLARFVGRRDTLPAPVVRTLLTALLACERALPSARGIEALLRHLNVDAVLVSPLVTGGSPQTDYIKSARALGLPTAVCVASWDNLTNKGLVRVVPDRVFVWNAAQRREAIELHRVPADRVVLTGAQPFDRWFGRRPTASREEFCRRVGLDPSRPFITFVGSTSNITDASGEDRFQQDWIRALRASGDAALAAPVGVRPHEPNAVVWPPERPNSVIPEARDEYFDSLFHSGAIVGINTSAMVEGAIVGRPVLTVRLLEFESAQDGTLHFDHLLPENGGPLFVAPSFELHARQLAEVLADPAAGVERNAAFVSAFIRPHGLDTPSNPRLVAAIETLEHVPLHAERTAPLVWLRPVLRAVAAAERRREREPALREKLERLRLRPGSAERALQSAADRTARMWPAAASLRLAVELVRLYEYRRALALKRRVAAEKERRGARREFRTRALKRRPEA